MTTDEPNLIVTNKVEYACVYVYKLRPRRKCAQEKRKDEDDET